MGAPVPSPVHLLIDRDLRFINSILKRTSTEELGRITDQWISLDTRWSRQEAARYFSRFESSPGHEVVVRRWIRYLIETPRPDPRIFGSVIAFSDAICRRNSAPRFSWSPGRGGGVGLGPFAGRIQRRGDPDREVFSVATRRYLQRQLWKRLKAFGMAGVRGDVASGEMYREVAFEAARRYRDRTTDNWVHLFECRGLLKVVAGRHPELRFTSNRIWPRSEETFDDVVGSFRHPRHACYATLWKDEHGLDRLERLTVEADSMFVRDWAHMMVDMVPQVL